MASPLVAAIKSLEDKITSLEEKVHSLDFKCSNITSTTVSALVNRLNVLEQKLLVEGGQGKAIGGRNTYDVRKDPSNVVPGWAK
jgi:CII-binding regulator of phage lambda lysogenization HflD